MLPFLGLSQNTEMKVLNLDECIKLAIQNNLELKRQKLTEETSAVNFKQNKNALLPNINGNYNLGISTGRSIDPFTNGFVNEKLTFSNAGLGLDAIVFNGFRLINSWKQARFNLEAAEMNTEAAKQELILNVTLTYLQALNAQDLVQLAKARVATTEGQLNRLQSFFEEETGNPAEYRDLQGQMAADRAYVSESEKAYNTEIINLNTLLNSEETIIPAAIDQKVKIEPYTTSAVEVYTNALTDFPSVKASDLSLKAANKGVAVARSGYTPEIRVFANLNTNYSSAARLFTENGNTIVETGDYVTINNENIPILSQQTNFTNDGISYKNQFDNNLNSSVGVAVSVPIFNGFRTKNNVALEKIKREDAEAVLEQTKLQLRQAIDQSYNTMQTSYTRYMILQEQVNAYQESFRINEIRFNNGVSNSVDYLISKNNLDTAQINLANVVYDYLLRVKVLEYYRGNI